MAQKHGRSKIKNLMQVREARLLGLDAPTKVANTDAAADDYTAEMAAAVCTKLLG